MAYHIGEACIGCTVCARLCPVQAITGERNALHVIREARCVQCGVCGWICPRGAVTDSSGAPCAALPKSLWPKPEIDKGRCTACGICVSGCRAGALRISMPAFRGDIQVSAELFAPAMCVGCGLCSRDCPVHAITMKGGGNP